MEVKSIRFQRFWMIQLNLEQPYPLKQTESKSFMGSVVLGKGFVIRKIEYKDLLKLNPKNKEVLFPYLNGDDLNNAIDQIQVGMY